ncbi:hypothetical protein MNV49_006420 [Pseudohyphozyma bogoriensis]|nr:hypothetical protein MNV49_006420 [Pseudohyphozyma bogoriensis]
MVALLRHVLTLAALGSAASAIPLASSSTLDSTAPPTASTSPAPDSTLSPSLLACVESCLYAGGHYYSSCKSFCEHSSHGPKPTTTAIPAAHHHNQTLIKSRNVQVPGQGSIFILENERHVTSSSSSSSSPPIVLVPGLGDSAVGWAAVIRLLSPNSHHVMSYDRLGLGRSSRTNLTRGAATMASELHALLLAAEIPPPYLLVGHSYAGAIVRQFVEQFDDEVVGLVLVDANHEDSVERLQWPNEAWARASVGVDVYAATGVYEAEKLTKDEWDAVLRYQAEDLLEADETGVDPTDSDAAEYESSLLALGKLDQLERHVMGDRPVGIIMADITREATRLLAACEAAGNVDAADRATIEASLKRLPYVEIGMQYDFRRLSESSRIVVSSYTGHEVMIWEPELVVEQVGWVMRNLVK